MSRPLNPLQTAETKASIVAAAARVFGRSGFSAATMAEIAGEAGVSPGLAYRYGLGKEELYRHALHAALDRAEAGLLVIRDGSTAPAKDQIERLIREYHALVEPQPDLPGLLTDPRAHRWIDESLDLRLGRIAEAFRDWVRGLGPAEDLDVDEYALLVLSALVAWFAPTPVARYLGAGPDSSPERTNRHQESLARLLVQALRP